MSVKCVLLAAGVGERQGPITNQLINRFANVKPLLPTVGGRRIIDFALAAAGTMGVMDIEVSAGMHWQLFRKLLLRNGNYSLPGFGDYHLNIVPGERPRDTLGDAKAPFEKQTVADDDTIVVMCSDIVHNIDLSDAVNKHRVADDGKQAAATTVVMDVDWDNPEWQKRGFPLVVTQGMPYLPGSKEARHQFECDLGRYVSDSAGEIRRVTDFVEKTDRGSCPSNVSLASVFLFSGRFFKEMMAHFRPRKDKQPFSDFGFHVFPLLAGKYGADIEGFENINDKIKRGDYPFFAYYPKQTGYDGLPLYWNDIFDPLALWKMNIDALKNTQMINRWLQRDPRFREEPWGWVGNGSYVSDGVKIGDNPERSYYQDGVTVIGSNVSVSAGSKIGRSYIDDNTHLQPGTEVFDTMISLGYERPYSYIGKTNFVKCLVLGEGFPPNFADINLLRNALVFNVPYFDGFGIVPLQLVPDKNGLRL